MNPYTVSPYLRVTEAGPAQARPAWQDKALCAQAGADPEAFYPEPGGHRSRDVKRICRSCKVRAECLTDALGRAGESFGIWGGTSPEERKALRRRFRGDVAAAVDFALRDQDAEKAA